VLVLRDGHNIGLLGVLINECRLLCLVIDCLNPASFGPEDDIEALLRKIAKELEQHIKVDARILLLLTV